MIRGEFSQKFCLLSSLASANPGDIRRLAACPGRPKDTNRQISASRCSALLSFGPFRPRLRIAMTVSSHRSCRSPIFQRVSKLLVKAMAWPRRCPRLFCLQTDLGSTSPLFRRIFAGNIAVYRGRGIIPSIPTIRRDNSRKQSRIFTTYLRPQSEYIMKGREILRRSLGRVGAFRNPDTWPAMGVNAGGESNI